MNVPPEDPELLVVAAAEPTMASLIAGLDQHGIAADLVHDIGDARETFLARGGHRLLVLAPDLTARRAQQISRSLTTVDPDLPVVAFAQQPPRTRQAEFTRWIHYHPSSLAAVGAVLKALHDL